jgi:hypothetical protein
MAELLPDIEGAETFEYKGGLLVRIQDGDSGPLREWYFEFRDDAHTLTKKPLDATRAADPSGLPSPNVTTVEIYAYLGAKEINGQEIKKMSPEDRARIEAQANAISPLLLAGHVAVSFDGGQTLYGFTPHAPGLEAKDVVRMLQEGKVFPGQVAKDNAHYDAAYKMASARGWKIEVEHVAVTFDPSETPALAQLALAEMAGNARGEHPHGYWFPPKGATTPPDTIGENGHHYAGECIANCATWIRFLGFSLPEISGRMSEYMPKFTEWANADEPIAGHSSKEDQ